VLSDVSQPSVWQSLLQSPHPAPPQLQTGQTPPEQSAKHAAAHAPQLADVLSDASQPLFALPSQSPKPVSHAPLSPPLPLVPPVPALASAESDEASTAPPSTKLPSWASDDASEIGIASAVASRPVAATRRLAPQEQPHVATTHAVRRSMLIVRCI
jgi:hypothetical protein